MSTASTAPLDELFEFLRFPSISTDPAYAQPVADCAEWLVGKFRRMGLAAQAHPTGGHPVVVARNEPRPDRRTVLIYGHYDVQPVDPLHLWTTPPFEPRVENGILYARGAADNKGQIFAHILGVERALREQGDLPVNVIFLIEGEEECGSDHLEAFLQEHRATLRPDIIAISDTGMVAPGAPSLTYGLRGILALEVRLRGAAADLHSGIYGGIAPNPATLLARLLASLHDDAFRVAVPGFYDAVVPLQSWERDEWARLPLDEAALKQVIRSHALLGETGYSPLERAWGRPTAEVNGIGGGYQGQGSKTVIPSEAFAKLTFRLVPNQTPAEIEAKVRAHLERHAPPEVRIEITPGHGGEPFLCNPNSPDGMAARRALARTFGVQPALIREGGSIPILQTFQRVLESDILLLGLALPDCAAHAPDENFPLAHFEAGIRMNAILLEELAAVR
jgi:acetylornithine deacetylase/succinyl-diaminopimelate desuccinylase-like protein